MKRWVAILLLAPLVSSTPSGEQSALGTDSITHLDQYDDLIIASWEDGRTGLQSTAKNTWSLYDDGTRLRTSTAAPPNCSQSASCVSEVLDVFVGPNHRFIVASNDGGLFGSGRLTLGTQQNGISQRIQFQNEDITAFAASEDGSKVAVATRNAFNQFNLSLYHWTGSNPGNVVSQWSKEIPVQADVLDINDEGNGAFAFEDEHVRFTAAGTLHQRTMDAFVTTINYGPGYWSLAGLAGGQIIAFGPNSNQAPYAQEFEFHPFDDEITAADWVDKDSFFTGDKFGRLTHYWNIKEALTSNELIWTQTIGEVVGLETEGEYLAVLTTTNLRMKGLDGANYWTREGAATQVGVAANGYASIGTAAGVIPFAAVYSSEVLVPKYIIQTAGKQSKSISIENEGNRAQTFAVATVLDAGWSSSSPTPVTLAPGEKTTVPLEIQAPGLIGAGTYTMELQVSSGNEPLRSFDLNITVPSENKWDLIADGSSTIGTNAGEVARFPFHVDNNGNEANTPAVELSTLSGWPAAINETWSLVPPQGSISGELVVTVPANAAEAMEGIFFVDIPGHDSLEFQVIVGANYGVSMKVPELIPPFEAGATVTLTLQVTNTGNGMDNFRLKWSGTPTDWNISYNPDLLLSVGGGSVAEVPITIETSKATEVGTYKATLHVNSISDQRFFDEAIVLFSPQTGDVTGPEEKESPFLPLGLVLVGLLAARRKLQ